MITHLVALSTCAGGPDLQVVEKLLANTAVQRRIICRFLPGRNPASLAKRGKLGGSALPRAEGRALSGGPKR